MKGHVLAPQWVSGSREFLHLPCEIVGMILESMTVKDLRSTRKTCKQLGTLGLPPLFRDHHVNLDGKNFIKFVEMSRHPTVAASICSLTLCSFQLLPQSDRRGGVDLTDAWWEAFMSIRFGCIDAHILRASCPPGDYPEGSSPWDVLLNILSTALSKLTQCKKIALKDISEGRRLDDVPRFTPMSFIQTNLLAVMSSTIKMEHLDILIGEQQEHLRSIAIDMLPDLKQDYSSLRRLHISIDSRFSEPAHLQAFLLSFPNISDFSLRVSSNVFHVKSLGVLGGLIIPKLEKLLLEAVECTAAELGDFLFQHTQTLQRVRLIRISSISDTQAWLDILHKVRHSMSLGHFSAHQCLRQEALDVARIAGFARLGYDSLESSTSYESHLGGQATTEHDPNMTVDGPE